VRGLKILGLALVLAGAGAGVAVAAPKPLELSALVIQPGEFPGFVATAPPVLYKTPQQWARLDSALSGAQASAQTTRLDGEGFVAVAYRQLGTPTREPWSGVSWVMQLRSAAAAKAELAAEVRDTVTTTKPPDTYVAFAVSGIPGAHGYVLASPSGTGDNVQFADGACVYLVGDGWAGKPKNAPTTTQLVAAATKLYKRVHGRPLG
jgi:hypothetical protein